MIPVTRLDGSALFVNLDVIVSIERTPDTVLALLNGDSIVVRETPEALLELALRFKRRVVGAPDEDRP